MYTIKTIVLVAFLGLINYSFFSTTATVSNTKISETIQAFETELCAAYDAGENIILVDNQGKEYFNPNETDLQQLAPALFDQNRIRVTLTSRSDNDLCSTELVITGESGGIVGNYSINNCSSYGWIFFTTSNCFDVALFHDAGLEAPFGSSINGSVDWSFQFNDNSRITGTYMDLGAANMFKVASPCYKAEEREPMNAAAALEMDKRRRNSSLGY